MPDSEAWPLARPAHVLSCGWGRGNEALEGREGEAQLCEAGWGELNSSCQETPGVAITFGRGGKLRTHFTETSQLPAPGPRRAGDCGLWVCPGRVAEQVGLASPSCGHPAWGAPAGRLEVEGAQPSLPAHTSGPSFWGSRGPGAFRGQGVWLPSLGELPRAGWGPPSRGLWG